jgi:uncharacterized coiled-coil protein SlyX
VTDDLDHQVQQALKRRRGSSKGLLYVFLVTAVAGTSGYIWLNYDSLANLAFAERPSGKPAIESNGAGVAQKDFETLKRETAESFQSMNEVIAAQKAELKGLSDQISALTVKVDAMQSAAPAFGAISAPAEPRQPPAAMTPAIAARKKAPKTTGPISVGGAPLPPAPRDGQ